MTDDLNDRLTKLRERREEAARLERLLDEARKTLQKQKSELATLRDILRKEARDVEQLEGLSLQNLFRTLLGDKEEQLRKERQEYLTSKLRHDRYRASVESTEGEIAEYSTRRRELGDVDSEYRTVLEEKGRRIMASHDSRTTQLSAIAERIGETRAQVKEIMEALEAGERALAHLDMASSSMSSASNWGVWDMVGGGILATHVKHSRIDDARGHIHRAQGWLERFRRELADVNIDADIKVGIRRFTKFADYFFDNLLTDWVVQSRIQNSKEEIVKTASHVRALMTQLEATLKKRTHSIDQLEEERRTILEST